jgi:glutathione S-transferase
MPNRIFASELSPFSARLRIACALKGLDYVFDPPPGGSGSTDFKKLAPFGRIPALECGNTLLVESVALLEYLEDAHPDSPSLRPADPINRARVRMLELLFDHNVIKAMGGVFIQLVKPLPDPNAARVAFDEVTTELEKLTLYFDAAGPSVGGRWSTADCAMAPFAFLMDVLSVGFGAESPTRRVPRFTQWWEECGRLPEVVEVTSRMQRGLVAMAAAKTARAVTESNKT